jgi:hypothetical protein
MFFLNKSYARKQGQAVKATLYILLKEESHNVLKCKP